MEEQGKGGGERRREGRDNGLLTIMDFVTMGYFAILGCKVFEILYIS